MPNGYLSLLLVEGGVPVLVHPVVHERVGEHRVRAAREALRGRSGGEGRHAAVRYHQPRMAAHAAATEHELLVRLKSNYLRFWQTEYG